jgi:hypothetical protein
MRFDEDAPTLMSLNPYPMLLFEKDDLASALEGKEILIEPNCPSPGVRVAMIIDDGAPIELLEFRSQENLRDKAGRHCRIHLTSNYDEMSPDDDPITPDEGFLAVKLTRNPNRRPRPVPSEWSANRKLRSFR